MSLPRSSTPALSLLLTALLSACGEEVSMEGVEPIDADFVLSVFEVQEIGGNPCAALSNLQSEVLGDGVGQVAFPTQDELLRVLDCRWDGEDVLYEGTGRLLKRAENRIGWELFSQRTTPGGQEFVISGRGEGDAFVALLDGERIAWVNLETQHQSSTNAFRGSLRYEGSWPHGRALLLHRRVGARANGPWLCVAIELH